MMSFNHITTVFVHNHGESALPLNPFFRAPILNIHAPPCQASLTRARQTWLEMGNNEC